jgi:HPr kinase/phosphorylase
MKREKVTVEKFFEIEAEALQLKLLAGKAGLDRFIREPTVNRPGLVLAGFTQYFASKRIQVMGYVETSYLKTLSEDEKRKRYATMFQHKIPCVVYSRSLPPDEMLLEIAEKNGVPVFDSPLITMKFINLATLALEMLFAPKGTELGSMVDILGVGAIIRGESGIGKSECVLALIERGYSLVSDDAVRVTVIDGNQVVGTGDDLMRAYMEGRGIGIINVAAMFGVKSVRKEKRVDLVVTLKAWEDVKDINRVGIDQETVKILGVDVPHVIIPVRPGRDLARLVEVAAFQTKLRLSGHNPAEDLNNRLIAKMTKSPDDNKSR